MLRSLLYFSLAETRCTNPAAWRSDTDCNARVLRGYAGYRLTLNPAVWLASRGKRNRKRLRAPKQPYKESRQPSP